MVGRVWPRHRQRDRPHNKSLDVTEMASWRGPKFWKHVQPKRMKRRSSPLSRRAARWDQLSRFELMFVVTGIVNKEALATGPVRTRLSARRRRAVRILKERFGENGFTEQWSTKRLPWEVR